jgi:pimeloyl-ACP methyl ester carboxylesterase
MELILIIFILTLILALLAAWWLVQNRGISETTDLPYKTSRIHRYKDLDIHYQQSGKGKDLVLLHGIGASTYIWRYLIPILEKNFRVTAVDIVGFGLSGKYPNYDYGLDSQTKTTHEFLLDIGIDEAYLVGSSMGGAIALWMAKTYPASYKKIVAMSPAVNPKHTKNIRLSYINLMGKRFRLFLNAQVMSQALRFVVAKKELYAKEHIAAYLRPYQDDGSSIVSFMRAFDSLLKDRRLPHDLKNVTSQVLLIWGKRDLLTPIRYASEIEKILPHATLVVHETAGHHMMEEEPEWTAENLAAFLRP